MTKDDWEDILVRTAHGIDRDLRVDSISHTKFSAYTVLDFIANVECRQNRIDALNEIRKIPFETIQKIIEARGELFFAEGVGHWSDRLGYEREFTDKMNSFFAPELHIKMHEPLGQNMVAADVPVVEVEADEQDARRIGRRFSRMAVRRFAARFEGMAEANRDEAMIQIIDRILDMVADKVT